MDLISIKARIKLKTAAEGGRYSGIKAPYRPNHVFERDARGRNGGSYMGNITFDQEWIQPGEEAMVTVAFFAGQSIGKYLVVGTKWWICEGPNLVAEAEIVEV